MSGFPPDSNIVSSIEFLNLSLQAKTKDLRYFNLLVVYAVLIPIKIGYRIIAYTEKDYNIMFGIHVKNNHNQ